MEKITDMVELKTRLLEMLENGIEVDNGEYRKMDFLDYYELTDINPRSIYQEISSCVSLTPHERQVLVTFAKRSSSLGANLSKEQLENLVKNEKLVIKGQVITDEIKQEAIRYLEENNLPFRYIVYQTYIRRVANQMAEEMKRD